MILRIRERDDENNKLNVLSVIDLKDSDFTETIKTLKFMKDNNLFISINENGVADPTDNKVYEILYIEFEFPNIYLPSDERTIPCITIDVTEGFY